MGLQFEDDNNYSERIEKAGIELYKAVRDLECCVMDALPRTKKAMEQFQAVAPQAEKQWVEEHADLTDSCGWHIVEKEIASGR